MVQDKIVQTLDNNERKLTSTLFIKDQTILNINDLIKLQQEKISENAD